MPKKKFYSHQSWLAMKPNKPHPAPNSTQVLFRNCSGNDCTIHPPNTEAGHTIWPVRSWSVWEIGKTMIMNNVPHSCWNRAGYTYRSHVWAPKFLHHRPKAPRFLYVFLTDKQTFQAIHCIVLTGIIHGWNSKLSFWIIGAKARPVICQKYSEMTKKVSFIFFIKVNNNFL